MTARRHAVSCVFADAGASDAVTRQACLARPARDLPGHRDDIAATNRLDGRAHFQHLGDTFVADCKWWLERGDAGDKPPIQIAIAGSDGPDERLQRPFNTRRGLFHPAQLAGHDDRQFLHAFPQCPADPMRSASRFRST